MSNETTLTKYLLDNMGEFYMNPSSMQQVACDAIALALQGKDIVDPSTPFVLLLETATCAAATSIAKSEILTRRQYSYLAQTLSDLYYHMSDTDYVGVFGMGGKCNLRFMIPYQQLLTKAVPLISGSPVKTVIIPRDTQITVQGITLQLGYAVIINILPGDQVHAYYDTSIPNPLIPYFTNVIDCTFMNYNNGIYLSFTLPAIQTASFTKQFTLGQTSSFYQRIKFVNKFSYARVFINTGNAKWVEIPTTFSDKVYDINIPTALLAVNEDILTVTLPDIYQTLNTAGTALRVDVYTTLGDITTDLSQITYSDFSAVWSNFDNLNSVNISASAALSSINDIIISATNALTGGNDPLSFEEVYNRVVYRVNSSKALIKPSDITIRLLEKGYYTEVLRNTVSTRTYLASKKLPPNLAYERSVVPMATNSIVTVSPKNYALNDIHSLSVISHPSNKLTILPSALFVLGTGGATILSDNEAAVINAKNKADLCKVLNTKTYMYSPFVYILDYSMDIFVGRVYHLSNPSSVNRTLETQNTARTYNIATMLSSIKLVGNSYVLSITAAVPVSIPTVVCQLSYTDSANNVVVFLSETSVVRSNQATFTFNLTTNFDVNEIHQLELTNLVTKGGIAEPLFYDLTTKFDLFYLIPGDKTGLSTNFDNLFSTPTEYALIGVIGATHETITLNFGKHLPSLYCPVLENLTTGGYLTYTEDIPAVYTEVVYKTGPNGVSFTIDESGEVLLEVLHNVGDPVLNDTGTQVLLHKAGEPILNNGKVIPSSTYKNGVSYSIGVTLIDAKYRYATAPLTKQYADTLPDIILGYLENDIDSVAKQLGEKTRLWYKPNGEVFNIEVNLGNNQLVEVPGILDIQITVYMSDDGLKNLSMQSQTTSLIRGVITSQLALNTLSVSSLTEALSVIMPNQASTFAVDKYLPGNVPMMTLVDPTQTVSLGSTIQVMVDGTLDVIDSITVLYKAST